MQVTAGLPAPYLLEVLPRPVAEQHQQRALRLAPHRRRRAVAVAAQAAPAWPARASRRTRPRARGARPGPTSENERRTRGRQAKSFNGWRAFLLWCVFPVLFLIHVGRAHCGRATTDATVLRAHTDNLAVVLRATPVARALKCGVALEVYLGRGPLGSAAANCPTERLPLAAATGSWLSPMARPPVAATTFRVAQ